MHVVVNFRPGNTYSGFPDMADSVTVKRALETATKYADTMIEHGRDRYGPRSSPLFASQLNRQSMAVYESESDVPELGGQRDADRSFRGSNPMHDQDLYRLLYLLGDMVSRPGYAAAADSSLSYFFRTTQSPVSGFFTWGEHLYWDLLSDSLPVFGGNRGIHELYRPWALWQRSYELAPLETTRFAEGLWNVQIGDHETGGFSRHAGYFSTTGGTGAEFPRHGGFYISTWAHAFVETGQELFSHAVSVLVKLFESELTRDMADGSLWWSGSWLSLAVDLGAGATTFSAHGKADLANAMTALAARIDTAYGQRVPGASWGCDYGGTTPGSLGLMCRERFLLTGDEQFRHNALATAENIVRSVADEQRLCCPGNFGDAIMLMLASYRMTGDPRYPDAALRIADQAIRLFWDDSSGLPRATTQNTHYETLTRADTAALSLLYLWCCLSGRGEDLRIETINR